MCATLVMRLAHMRHIYVANNSCETPLPGGGSIKHLFMRGGSYAPPLTAGWRMCATTRQLMGRQGDWLDESRGPCNLRAPDSPSSTRGLVGGVHSPGASEVVKGPENCQKPLFSQFSLGKFVLFVAHCHSQTGLPGGVWQQFQGKAIPRGVPRPPSGQQGGLAHMRHLRKTGAYHQFTPPKLDP